MFQFRGRGRISHRRQRRGKVLLKKIDKMLTGYLTATTPIDFVNAGVKGISQINHIFSVMNVELLGKQMKSSASLNNIHNQ